MIGAGQRAPGSLRCAPSRPRGILAGQACAALEIGPLLASNAARSSALDDCSGLTRTRTELMACLQAARKQATNDMLESFLAVDQTFGGREPDAARTRAQAALKQSQRDFERDLQAHCRVAQALVTGETAGPAAAACEVDQQRARAVALEELAAGSRN